jgi:hypothetical protein
MGRTIDKAASQELITTDNGTMPANGALVVAGPPTITTILAAAVDKGMAPESLDKLLAVYERMEAKVAAKQAAEDLAAFQSECPVIAKSATAKIATKSGGSYSYQYAPLDTIANTIRPHLTRHGLSYTWDSDEADGRIACTCTVRHVNGHAFTARFSCGIDTAAAMSGAQKSAAALTFARRQSLVQALGLTTGENDSDATADTGATINEHELANLRVLIDEVKQDVPRFLKWAGVARLDDIPADKVGPAFHFLESKRGGK